MVGLEQRVWGTREKKGGTSNTFNKDFLKEINRKIYWKTKKESLQCYQKLAHIEYELQLTAFYHFSLKIFYSVLSSFLLLYYLLIVLQII